MNKIMLMGRLTRDPEVRFTQGENPTAVARYSLAVDRRFKRDDGIATDFFHIVAFGNRADFSEKYLRKGMKMLITGRVQTGYYDNKDGVKVPFFEIVVEEQEFAESKGAVQPGGDAGYLGGIPNDIDRDSYCGNSGRDYENSREGSFTERDHIRVSARNPLARIAEDEDGFLYCPDDFGSELPFD
ncbi:MAG: single-stranded DNA-binding protein [Clostridiales bacterium]|nr:single-stranded DNA-binding protein [Clostridiales bacterium]